VPIEGLRLGMGEDDVGVHFLRTLSHGGGPHQLAQGPPHNRRNNPHDRLEVEGFA
jgi:hypothetical protein